MEVLYLLDTNICIYIRQKKPETVLRHLEKLRPGEAGLSIITYGELIYGAKKSKHSIAALERVRELTTVLPPLPLPEAAAECYGAVRAELDELDKDLPLENVRTLTHLMDSALAQRRLSVQLVAGFAGMALLLTAIGLYGVLAYIVGQRSREIGIRMALGARQRDVLAIVLGEGMSFMGIGVLAGLAGAFGLTRLLRSLLFGVTATDPLTYILVPILLVVVALLACLLPARRAVNVDPVVALRTE